MANAVKAKLEAQKELFEEYQDHSNYYGRREQDLQSHTLANMRYLENSIKENLKEAAIHRKMAQEGEKNKPSV